MVVERVTETKQIVRVLTHENQGNIVTLYTALGSASHYVKGEVLNFDVHLNSTINCLHAITEIQSLQATQLPQSSFSGLNEGVNLRLAGLLPDTPRKRIEVLFRDFNGEWEHLAWCDTVRSNFYPSISFDLRALISPRGLVPMAEGSEIGVRVVNIGNGFLQGDDRVTLWGAVTEETSLFYYQAPTETVTTVEETPQESSHFVGEVITLGKSVEGQLILHDGFYWLHPKQNEVVNQASQTNPLSLPQFKDFYVYMWDDKRTTVLNGKTGDPSQAFDDGRFMVLNTPDLAAHDYICTGVKEGELN